MELEKAVIDEPISKQAMLERPTELVGNPLELVEALTQAAAIIEAIGSKSVAAGEPGSAAKTTASQSGPEPDYAYVDAAGHRVVVETKTVRRAVETESDAEQQYHYISDSDLDALTATFTELASSAGRVAASLSKINALSKETHTELNATWQALTPLTLSAEEQVR